MASKAKSSVIKLTSDDINRNAPEGSWSSNGGDAFYPRHELRARNQSNLMNSDKKYNDAYYLQQFRQFEQTRNFTLLSPIAQFDYMNEASNHNYHSNHITADEFDALLERGDLFLVLRNLIDGYRFLTGGIIFISGVAGHTVK